MSLWMGNLMALAALIRCSISNSIDHSIGPETGEAGKEYPDQARKRIYCQAHDHQFDDKTHWARNQRCLL